MFISKIMQSNDLHMTKLHMLMYVYKCIHIHIYINVRRVRSAGYK